MSLISFGGGTECLRYLANGKYYLFFSLSYCALNYVFLYISHSFTCSTKLTFSREKTNKVKSFNEAMDLKAGSVLSNSKGPVYLLGLTFSLKLMGLDHFQEELQPAIIWIYSKTNTIFLQATQSWQCQPVSIK